MSGWIQATMQQNTINIVENKFQETNKTKISHINGTHIKLEVSSYFWGIWPIVRRWHYDGAAWAHGVKPTHSETYSVDT